MRTSRLVIHFTICSAACGLLTPRANAQFGAVQRTLFRAMEYANNHLLLSSPQNGPFFNNNQFDQRLEFNRAADGYTYESWRFFGPDSYNNPNTLDLGPVKIQLGRDPSLLGSPEPAGLHTRVGYTKRFIPEVFFQQETAIRLQDVFAGTSESIAAPLRYNITVNTGIEDIELDGNVLVDTDGRINALGFYDLNVRVINEGTYNADGSLVVDEQVTDFDVGPINVSGNIVIDLISSATQMLAGVNEPAIPFRIGSAASQRDRSLDEILAGIQAGEELTEADRESLVRQTLASAFLNDPLGTMLNGLPSTSLGRDDITLSFSEGDAPVIGGQVIPEPGTLALLAAVSAFAVAGRNRRARRS